MMKKALSLCIAMMLPSITSFQAHAEYEAQALIDYRQNVMESIKGHNQAIKMTLEGKVPYDDIVEHHMSSLENMLGIVGELFPEGSDFGETNAKDAIWDNPDKFNDSVRDAQIAFEEFSKVVAKGDKRASLAAFKKFGKDSCGSCHKSFKKKDD